VGDQVFSNNASALLAASIGSGDTVIQVDAGFGTLFPSPGVTEHARLRLVNASGDLEIVDLTERTSDLLTVVRGQEGTSAISWTLNVTRVELSLTKETMDNLLQKDGDTMDGALSMSGNNINDARLAGSTVMTGGLAVGTSLRGDEGDASNEVTVPPGGGRATAGGSEIVVLADNLMTLLPIGFISLWYTGLGSLPTGWQLCDGTNSSPDLRDLFVRGAGGAFSLGAVGGSATAAGNTSMDGEHTHTGGGAAAHVLTVDEMPAHNHRLADRGGGSGIADGTVLTNVVSISGTRNVATGVYTNQGTGLVFVEDTGGDAGHTHGAVAIGSAADHDHSLSNVAIIPPFHAVYYVMKVS